MFCAFRVSLLSSAAMILQPGYDNDLQSDPDDFLVPLVEPTSLRLDGNLGPYETFQECPYWVGGGTGPSEDALLQSWAEAVPFKRFYEKRRKSNTERVRAHRERKKAEKLAEGTYRGRGRPRKADGSEASP